jgi:dihydrofolate reductase
MKISILAALTIDGRLARDDAHFPDWTGREDKRMFRAVTRASGVLVMGSKTYAAIGKPLDDRRIYVMTRNSLHRSNVDSVVYTTDPPDRLVESIAATGCRHLIIAGGSVINTLFLEKGLVDELLLTFCPLAFGSGIGLFSRQVELSLRMMESRPFSDGSLFARYKVTGARDIG